MITSCSAAFVPGSSDVAIATERGTIRIIALASGRLKSEFTLGDEIGEIHDIGYSPDASQLYIGSIPPRIWDVGTENFDLATIPFPDRSCSATFGSADELLIANWDPTHPVMRYGRDHAGAAWKELPRDAELIERLAVKQALHDHYLPNGNTRLEAEVGRLSSCRTYGRVVWDFRSLGADKDATELSSEDHQSLAGL